MSYFTKYLCGSGKEDEDLKPGLLVRWLAHDGQRFKHERKHGIISHVEKGNDVVTVSEVVLKTYEGGSSGRHTGSKYDVNISELFICNSPGPQMSDDEDTPADHPMVRRSQANAVAAIAGDLSQDELLNQLTPVRDKKVVIHDFQVGMRVKAMDPLGEGTVKWMGHFKDELLLGLEMDEEADWYTGSSFGGETHFTCIHRRGHIVRAGTCVPLSEPVSPVQEASVEDGPVTLTEKDMKRYKIQLCIGKKEVVPGRPGKGTVRWIGYLDGEQHLSVGYELDKPGGGYGDGTHHGWKLFDCPAHKGLFVKLFPGKKHPTDRELRIPVEHVKGATGSQMTGAKLSAPKAAHANKPCSSSAAKAQHSPDQIKPVHLTAQQHKLDFDFGDVVEVEGTEGTVCWIGYNINQTEIFVGLEMAEEGNKKYGYGDWRGFPLFDTLDRRTSYFVNAKFCRKKEARGEEFPLPLNAADLGLEFDIGSRVELVDGMKGKVRWIGTSKNENLVGLVMDVRNKQHYNKGELDNYQVFEGPPDRCRFIPCSQVNITFVEGEAEEPITMSSAELGLSYEIDSRVELEDGKRGRVRWIGRYGNKLLVGLEMQDRDMQHYHHGMLGQYKLFEGPPHQCHFVPCDQVKTVFDDPIPTAIDAAELGLDYNIGDVVRVKDGDQLGKVRWIGKFKGRNLVGLEMNVQGPPYGTDGRLGDYEVFQCKGRRSRFVECHECRSVAASKSKHKKNNESAIPEAQVTQSPHMDQRAEVQSTPSRTPHPKGVDDKYPHFGVQKSVTDQQSRGIPHPPGGHAGGSFSIGQSWDRGQISNTCYSPVVSSENPQISNILLQKLSAADGKSTADLNCISCEVASQPPDPSDKADREANSGSDPGEVVKRLSEGMQRLNLSPGRHPKDVLSAAPHKDDQKYAKPPAASMTNSCSNYVRKLEGNVSTVGSINTGKNAALDLVDRQRSLRNLGEHGREKDNRVREMTKQHVGSAHGKSISSTSVACEKGPKSTALSHEESDASSDTVHESSPTPADAAHQQRLQGARVNNMPATRTSDGTAPSQNTEDTDEEPHNDQNQYNVGYLGETQPADINQPGDHHENEGELFYRGPDGKFIYETSTLPAGEDGSEVPRGTEQSSLSVVLQPGVSEVTADVSPSHDNVLSTGDSQAASTVSGEAGSDTDGVLSVSGQVLSGRDDGRQSSELPHNIDPTSTSDQLKLPHGKLDTTASTLALHDDKQPGDLAVDLSPSVEQEQSGETYRPSMLDTPNDVRKYLQGHGQNLSAVQSVAGTHSNPASSSGALSSRKSHVEPSQGHGQSDQAVQADMANDQSSSEDSHPPDGTDVLGRPNPQVDTLQHRDSAFCHHREDTRQHRATSADEFDHDGNDGSNVASLDGMCPASIGDKVDNTLLTVYSAPRPGFNFPKLDGGRHQRHTAAGDREGPNPEVTYEQKRSRSRMVGGRTKRSEANPDLPAVHQHGIKNDVSGEEKYGGPPAHDRHKRSSDDCGDASPEENMHKSPKLEYQARQMTGEGGTADATVMPGAIPGSSCMSGASTDKYFGKNGAAALESDVAGQEERKRDSENRTCDSKDQPPSGKGDTLLTNKEDVLHFVNKLKSTDGTRPKTPVATGPAAQQQVKPETCTPAELNTELEIDSMVELKRKGLYGLIKWLGRYGDKRMVGLEMEEMNPAGNDGKLFGNRLFNCEPGRALFVRLEAVIPDTRFSGAMASSAPMLQGSHQGTAEGIPLFSESVQTRVPAPSEVADTSEICGRWKGIQGHYNSCYLDATIYAMFAFCEIFDEDLERSTVAASDIEAHMKIQKILREDIVYPLRRDNYVDATKVLELRHVLDTVGPLKGLTHEEKDPEEFLKCLLEESLQCPPFLEFSNGNDSYYYQVFLENTPKLELPSTQQLVELSFYQGDIQLTKVPECFFVQMPRFGKSFRLYEKIVPSLELDITDILTTTFRECALCSQNAGVIECRDCFKSSLRDTVFCAECSGRWHKHRNRKEHQLRDIRNRHAEPGALAAPFPRHVMELVAVICIQTSHYVSFVRCGTDAHAPWVFFDSMADRVGQEVLAIAQFQAPEEVYREQVYSEDSFVGGTGLTPPGQSHPQSLSPSWDDNGYNIPEVTAVDDFLWWLSKDGKRSILQGSELKEHIKRLMSDGYMSLYRPVGFTKPNKES